MTVLSRRPALPLALLLGLAPLSAALPAGADAPQNTISAIQTGVFRGRVLSYDITLTSSAEFPMGNAVVTLRIGSQEFLVSRYGTDGTLHTLVFSLTPAQFKSLHTGDPVVIYYSEDNAALPAAQWNFGALDLSQLGKPPVIAPISPVSPALAPVMTTAAKGVTVTTAAKGITAMTAKTMTAATAMIAQKGHK